MILLSENVTHFPDYQDIAADGPVAIGGNLSPKLLLDAYAKGAFPWYNDDEPILWWSPDPRFVLFPDEVKVSKSMRNILNRNTFKVTKDQCFTQVVKECQHIKRKDEEGTWINDQYAESYSQLHQMGCAHSIEVWNADNELVGGLYGVKVNSVFCGESMFSKESNASKVALIHLTTVEQKFKLIDCQVYTQHLESLGAREIPRKTFLEYLNLQ